MLEIDHTSKTPAYRQVYQYFRRRIETGELAVGDRLPKIRGLASELGIARNTVEAAYRQLSFEGYAKGKRGVGYIVEELDFSILDTPQKEPDPPEEDSQPDSFDRSPVGPSYGCRYNFSYGNRIPGKVPFQEFKSIANQVLSAKSCFDAASYIAPYGLPELRKQLAKLMRQTRGVRCDYRKVILQPGTQPALSHIVRLFDYQERRVAIEDPGYREAQNAIESCSSEFVAVPVYEGHDEFIKALEKSDAKLVFVTPSNQYPLGFAMQLSVRLKLIEWAKRHDAYIIEDDYCNEYRYGFDPIPSLQSLDPEHVIYLGTMSKVLTPAIRISYLVLPQRLQERWDAAYGSTPCSLPWLDQELLARFMQTDSWGRYVRTTVNMYRNSHDLLVSSIEKEMGQHVDMVSTDAGLHIMVGDKRGRDMHDLVKLAMEKDVRVYDTDVFWANKEHPMRNYVLIGFSSIEPEDIAPGIKLLAEAWYK